MKKPQCFIIVDDDSLNNSLCRYVITKVASGVTTIDFIFPVEALAHIEKSYNDPECYCPTILFLDINMPILNGWNFLERFDKFSDHIKKQITIYILSSSVDWSDKEKADANPYVKDYLVKPLSRETLGNMLAESQSAG